MTPLVAVAYLLFFAPVTHAQQGVASTRPPAFATWDDARLQTYVTGALKEGRFYARAIQVSKELVKRNPKSLQAQLLLGSACASRFASVSYTLSQVDNAKFRQEQYQKQKDAWEKAQKEADPTAPPPLVPYVPTPLVTPDDGSPFTLTQEQANQQLVTLGRQAVAAFEAARALSETASTDEKVQCELTRGWGLFLLRQGWSKIVQDGPLSKNTEPAKEKSAAPELPSVVYVSQKEIVEGFERCVKLAPDNVQAWHSLSLALVPNRVLISGGGWDESPVKPEDRRAIDALDKAIALDPRNFDLLYQAGAITTKVDIARSLDYLQRALKRQSSNATVWYIVSERLFKQAEKKPTNADALSQKAKDAMQSGNNAPVYQLLTFVLPVPRSLQRPWQYFPVYGQEPDTVIAPHMMYHLENRIKNGKPGDEAEIMSDATLLLNLGFRMMSSIDQVALRSADTLAVGLAGGRMTIGSVMPYAAFDYLRKYAPEKPSQAYTDLREQYRTLAKQASEYQDTFNTVIY